jgi:hypothetical protein
VLLNGNNSLKRQDLAKVWKLISISMNLCGRYKGKSEIELKMWRNHPTGWRLIRGLILKLISKGDVQSVAMIGV